MAYEDFEQLPVWQQRILAPKMGFPSWAKAHPERLAGCTTESGVMQAWTFDLVSGKRRRVTDEPVGVIDAQMSPDGESVVWWLDPTGDESGHWMVTPWEGGEAHPLIEGIADGWSTAMSMVRDAVAVGLAHDDRDYRVYLRLCAGPAKVVYQSRETCGVGQEWPHSGAGGLSADGALLCIRHAESGDMFDSGVRVIDTATGKAVGELEEKGVGFEPAAWSPIEGDGRLAITHDRSGWRHPALWDPQSGEVRDLAEDLLGEVAVLDWWPDGSAMLAMSQFEGRFALHRIEVESRAVATLAAPGGEIYSAEVRPAGEVWMMRSTSVEPTRLTTLDGKEIVRPNGPVSPSGYPSRWIFATDPAGDRIQGFVLTPPGEPPFPTIVYSHGGPSGDSDTDRFNSEWLAYVDAGFAVVGANYRGSSGYGRKFTDAMRHTGEIGHRQTEDILAVLDAAIAEGIVDPARLGFAGWSWGGYMGLFMAGVHPEREWRGVFSGVPAAELVSAHWDSAPDLQAYDRAIMGGTPNDIPELFERANPYSYVSDVKAPVLVIAGDNDSRCPIAQVLKWCDAFREAGGDLTLYRFGTGHGSFDTREDLKQIAMAIDFLKDHVLG